MRETRCSWRHNTKLLKSATYEILFAIGCRVRFLDMFQAVFWFFQSMSGLPAIGLNLSPSLHSCELENPRSESTWTKHSCFRAQPNTFTAFKRRTSVSSFDCCFVVASHQTLEWSLNPQSLAFTPGRIPCVQLRQRLQVFLGLVRAIPVFHISSKAVFTTWTTATRGSEPWYRTSLLTEGWVKSKFYSTLLTTFRILSLLWNCRISK